MYDEFGYMKPNFNPPILTKMKFSHLIQHNNTPIYSNSSCLVYKSEENVIEEETINLAIKVFNKPVNTF